MEEHRIDHEKEPEESLSQAEAETQPNQSLGDDDQAKIDALLQENFVIREQLLRMAAEFDNYRKRNEREIGNIIQNANAELILLLLPVLDDLDRALAATQGTAECNPLMEAMRLVRKNFFKTLQDAGLTPMNALDQPFNPEKHDALLHIPVSGKASNLVVEEHKKGYEFRDRVIRHAQVIVSK
jgi:molecular chaperone GrpE